MIWYDMMRRVVTSMVLFPQIHYTFLSWENTRQTQFVWPSKIPDQYSSSVGIMRARRQCGMIERTLSSGLSWATINLDHWAGHSLAILVLYLQSEGVEIDLSLKIKLFVRQFCKCNLCVYFSFQIRMCSHNTCTMWIVVCSI